MLAYTLRTQHTHTHHTEYSVHICLMLIWSVFRNKAIRWLILVYMQCHQSYEMLGKKEEYNRRPIKLHHKTSFALAVCALRHYLHRSNRRHATDAYRNSMQCILYMKWSFRGDWSWWNILMKFKYRPINFTSGIATNRLISQQNYEF